MSTRKQNKKEERVVGKQNVRVRMAPSPTGPFHIGSARTALFNYLFAKKYNGKFILRIEDTDQERSRLEWEDDIKKSLLWLGLNYDEGPDKKGEYGPYHQSERKKIYKRYLEKMLEQGSAYWCFCKEQEIEAYKQECLSRGKPPVFECQCSELSEKDKKVKEGGVIRFKTPHGQVIFNDLIKGKITYDSALFGDMVIAKDIDNPLYNFACVVDDFEMKISHIIRGEEHLSNTPRQILLACALGIEPPEFLHLPLILNQQRAKLSKRDPSIAAKVADYIEQGYLPQAVVNFIALLGWNPGDNREIFSLAELEQEFSLEKVQKSGAIFNIQKMDWLNGYLIRKMPLNELTELCLPYLINSGVINRPARNALHSDAGGGEATVYKIAPMVALYQERLKKISEIVELTDFFFKELEYPKELLIWKEMGESELSAILDNLIIITSNIKENEWTKEKLNEVIMPMANELNDRGKILWPLRVALSGKQASAGPLEIAQVLGKEETIKRLKKASDLITQ